MKSEQLTPSWYLINSHQLWARWFNIIHWPYLNWHLSYPLLGIALAQEVQWGLVPYVVLAFFLGMGIAAHCFDLLRGDPLRLGLPRAQLWTVGLISLAGACGIGLWKVADGSVSYWLLGLIPLGALLALGYGLEWPGFHGDWQFAAWWAVFPMVVGYLAMGIALDPILPLGCLFAYATATAQRILSSRTRFLRRVVRELTTTGRVGGNHMVWGVNWVLGPLDGALAIFRLALPLLALTLLLERALR